MRRLRWQLTLSHLIAIAFTLLSMVGALVLIAAAWFNSQSSPSRRPAELARSVAQAMGGMVQDVPAEDLDTVLRVMASGQLRLVTEFGPPQRGPAGDANLSDASYVAVVNQAGQLLASSTPQGVAFAPPEQSEWAALAGQTFANVHATPVLERSGSGPAALGAAPILDGRGRALAAVIVAVPSLPAQAQGWLWPLAIFGVASVAVLAGASVFALVASTIIGYLLSRRLVGRLEQLGGAADKLRGGDLSARVPVSGADEVSQLQRAFNTMAADLERSVADVAAERDRVTGLLEARRQLVAGVSHELRTPIATLRGYLESALRRDGDLPHEVRADLNTADREVTRLEGMIDDLFTLSRAEVGRLELRLAPTDIGALVRSQVDTQGPLAWRQRQVQLLVEVPPEGPVGEVDAQRVAQIVSNLLSNAVRHTPPGGLVAASVAAEHEWVRIDVRDTGEGIPSEVLPHIFERFYQGADGAAAGGRGAGLGLALVKELAESMGGRVDVTSTVGEGSCFSVRFPWP